MGTRSVFLYCMCITQQTSCGSPVHICELRIKQKIVESHTKGAEFKIYLSLLINNCQTKVGLSTFWLQ